METTLEKTFADVPAGKHVMAVMGKEGDTKHIWDSSVEAEIEGAKALFETMTKKNKYAAFHVTGKDGSKGTQMHDFDPKAERVIFAPQMVGG